MQRRHCSLPHSLRAEGRQAQGTAERWFRRADLENSLPKVGHASDAPSVGDPPERPIDLVRTLLVQQLSTRL